MCFSSRRNVRDNFAVADLWILEFLTCLQDKNTQLAKSGYPRIEYDNSAENFCSRAVVQRDMSIDTCCIFVDE